MTFNKILVAVLPFIILGILCGTVQPSWAGKLLTVLDDLSQSVSANGDNDTIIKNVKNLESVIASAQKGDKILVMGFGRRSNVILLEAQMPMQAGPRDKNLRATRQAAIIKYEENLKERIGQVDRSKTDLHGAFLKASRMLQENGTDKYEGRRLYVISDLVDTITFGLSMRKLRVTGAGKVFWERSKLSTWPDLHNVDVIIYFQQPSVGHEFSEVDVEVATRELKIFWEMYIKRCGGENIRFETNF